VKAEKSSLIPAAALILCCLVFLLLSCLTCSRIGRMASVLAEKTPKTIVVDAGHGGEDGGAQGKSRVLEKDLNLAIAKDLQSLLQAAGFRVVMTRTSDTALSNDLDTIRARKTSDLKNRLRLVESQNSCILVSIHQNFFTQSRYSGSQLFYSQHSDDSKVLAEAIRARITGLLQKNNTRKCKPATSSIYLLWNTKVPAVLVECGFLSNDEEAALLNNQQYQKKMAFSIYCGLLDYCQTVS